MHHDSSLMIGMFWGGLIVAAVPVSVGLGVGIYVLKRYLAERASSTKSD